MKITHIVSAVILAGSTLTAAPISYFSFLSGLNENPANASPGTGFAFVTIDTAADTLFVQAEFQGLTGNTTAAHIHCCVAAPGNVGVATMTPSFSGFPLGVTAGSFSNTYNLTLNGSWNAAFITANGGTPAGAEAALAAGLLAGNAYFNIHTSTFGGGEIRGFLQAVPEPSTWMLTGIAVATLGFLRRRSRG